MNRDRPDERTQRLRLVFAGDHVIDLEMVDELTAHRLAWQIAQSGYLDPARPDREDWPKNVRFVWYPPHALEAVLFITKDGTEHILSPHVDAPAGFVASVKAFLRPHPRAPRRPPLAGRR